MKEEKTMELKVKEFTFPEIIEFNFDDLKKEIRTKERASYDAATIGADVQRMLTVYQRKGFFGTKIEPQRIELDNNRVNVVYEIDEGHPTWITDIKFNGNKKFTSFLRVLGLPFYFGQCIISPEEESGGRQ